MQYTHRNRKRIDEGLGSVIGRFLAKLVGRGATRTISRAGTRMAAGAAASGAARRGIGARLGMTLGKGAAATGLGVAGAYGIDKLASGENQFDSRDVVAKLTSDIQSFGRAVDLNNGLSAECRSKVKEYMIDIEEMLTQDLERHEKYFSGTSGREGVYPGNSDFNYGYTNTYRDNMYAPGHKR